MHAFGSFILGPKNGAERSSTSFSVFQLQFLLEHVPFVWLQEIVVLQSSNHYSRADADALRKCRNRFIW
jgi:hypothetical protein